MSGSSGSIAWPVSDASRVPSEVFTRGGLMSVPYRRPASGFGGYTPDFDIQKTGGVTRSGHTTS